ncbi:hypothetical protein E2562_017143, partial [Oryza meyeriana var. granulata]
MVQKSRGWSGFISEVLDVVLKPAGKSNARGKGDLIPSIDRPARLVSPVVDAVVGGGGPEQVAAMVQKSRGWSGFISEVLEVVLKMFRFPELAMICESNVGVVLISTLSTALRQNQPAGKSNARGKGDLIPSIDRPARLVSPSTLLAAQFTREFVKEIIYILIRSFKHN